MWYLKAKSKLLLCFSKIGNNRPGKQDLKNVKCHVDLSNIIYQRHFLQMVNESKNIMFSKIENMKSQVKIVTAMECNKQYVYI